MFTDNRVEQKFKNRNSKMETRTDPAAEHIFVFLDKKSIKKQAQVCKRISEFLLDV